MKRKAGRCEAREGGHPTVMMEWTPVGTKKRGRTTAENGGHEAPARSSDADMLSMFSSWLCDALRAASNAIDRDHAAVGGGEAQQAVRAWRARAIALKKEMTSVERVALHVRPLALAICDLGDSRCRSKRLKAVNAEIEEKVETMRTVLASAQSELRGVSLQQIPFEGNSSVIATMRRVLDTLPEAWDARFAVQLTFIKLKPMAQWIATHAPGNSEAYDQSSMQSELVPLLTLLVRYCSTNHYLLGSSCHGKAAVSPKTLEHTELVRTSCLDLVNVLASSPQQFLSLLIVDLLIAKLHELASQPHAGSLGVMEDAYFILRAVDATLARCSQDRLPDRFTLTEWSTITGLTRRTADLERLLQKATTCFAGYYAFVARWEKIVRTVMRMVCEA